MAKIIAIYGTSILIVAILLCFVWHGALFPNKMSLTPKSIKTETQPLNP